MKKAFALVGLLLAISTCARAQTEPLKIEKCPAGDTADWKHPELADDSQSYMILADGFRAIRSCKGVTVEIPGAFMDSLKPSMAYGLSVQLAAAVFVRACATDAANIDEAIESALIKAADVRPGRDKVRTEYCFKTKSGKVARIFVYFNDLYGMLGVVNIDAQPKSSLPGARKGS